MGALNRRQIEERLGRQELLRNPRRKTDGRYDIEKDSYDLAAGTAIWKNPVIGSSGGDVVTRHYVPQSAKKLQPTVTVQPGQMIFVVTLEDIAMPQDVCGTVYSRNSLALSGILALNAGHVDSGYHGPIVIRLINLRAMPWTLTLGDPIFTIAFESVKPIPGFDESEDRRESQESMILRVRETANAALSNALYDLYAVNVDQRLSEFKTVATNDFIDIRNETWVRKDQLWGLVFNTWWKKTLAGLAVVLPTLAAGGAIVAAVFTVLQYLDKPPAN